MALDDAEACTPNDDVREKEGGGAARELVHLREMDKKWGSARTEGGKVIFPSLSSVS